MKTNAYSILEADTMNGEYARSATLPLFSPASDTLWRRDVKTGDSLLVRSMDEIILDLNRQIQGVRNILPDILEITLDNIGDYNLSTLKAVLEIDRRTLVPVNVTSAGGRILRLNLYESGMAEKERTLAGNRRIRIQLKNGAMLIRNFRVCCDAKGRPLAHLRGRLLPAPVPVSEYGCHSDNNKNIISLTDDAGAVCAAWEYDAYGNIVNQIGDKVHVNSLLFSSEYHDEELGLVYYNYRHYNPKEGRWISRDPICEGDCYNLYLYNYNNSINNYDLWGMWSIFGDDAGDQESPNSFKEPWIEGTYLPEGPNAHNTDFFYTKFNVARIIFYPKIMYKNFITSSNVYKKFQKFMDSLGPDALEWFHHYMAGSGEVKYISPASMIKKNSFFAKKITSVARAGYSSAVSQDIIGVFMVKKWEADISSKQISIGDGSSKENNTDYWSIPYVLGNFYYATRGCVERRDRKYKLYFELYIDDWYWFHGGIWEVMNAMCKIEGARAFRTYGKSICSYDDLEGLKCE